MTCKGLSILIILFCSIFNTLCFISKVSNNNNKRFSIKNWNIDKRFNNNNENNITLLSSLNYPVIQVLLNSELKTEMFCDNDIELFVRKITSYLTQLSNEINHVNSNTNNNNVYSDDQLKQELLLNNVIVLKLFKQNCKKCVEFDKYYYNLYSTHESFSKYTWIHADAANIPNYISNLKSRLIGDAKSSDEEVVENCITCNNSGFTICTECDGKGIVNRGPNTVYCPQCVGYKKVRCYNCGGKCIRCSV
jgi:hypothetical protein